MAFNFLLILRRATAPCSPFHSFSQHSLLRSHRSFSQSKKQQPSSSSKASEASQASKASTTASSNTASTSSTVAPTPQGARVRKSAQFYRQHKPKTGLGGTSHASASDAAAALSEYSGVVTTASANRPTPKFADHQYSPISSSSSSASSSSFHFGPGSVPHETLGSSQTAAMALELEELQQAQSAGTQEHVRNMLQSLQQRHPTMLPTPTPQEQFELLLQGLRKSLINSSYLSRLLTLSLVGLVLFGDYLDRLFLDLKEDDLVYSFFTGGTEESVMKELHTGDVVVLQSPLLSFNVLNVMRVILRQFVCDGPYDHCGVIICNEHDSNFPYVVEVDQNQWPLGNALDRVRRFVMSGGDTEKNGKSEVLNRIKVTPFDERVLAAREPDVFVRRITRTAISPELNTKLSDWLDTVTSGEKHEQQNFDEIEQMFANAPKRRDSMWTLFKTLWLPGGNTMLLRSNMKELRRKIALHEFEIETQKNRKEANVAKDYGHVGLVRIRQTQQRIKNTDQLRQELIQMKLELQLKKDNLKKRMEKVNSNRRVICSEFVGHVWQYMKFLEPPPDGPTPREIRTNHFYDDTLAMPLAGVSILGPLQFVKTQLEGKKINEGEREREAVNARKFRILKSSEVPFNIRAR